MLKEPFTLGEGKEGIDATLKYLAAIQPNGPKDFCLVSAYSYIMGVITGILRSPHRRYSSLCTWLERIIMQSKK
jgi:hypothetical protein